MENGRGRATRGGLFEVTSGQRPERNEYRELREPESRCKGPESVCAKY